MLQIAAGGSATAALAWLFVTLDSSPAQVYRQTNSFTSVMASALVVACILYAFAFEYMLRRLKRRTYPDRVALARLLELIRDTESAIARTENWTALDRAQFQIRLARLTIGP